MSKFNSAKWIWLPNSGDTQNQWVEMRKSFRVQEVCQDASLCISADTDYFVWLNGKRVAFSQFSDYPQDKTYNQFPVADALIKGDNQLSILAFYQGVDTNRYRKGKAPVTVPLEEDEAEADRTRSSL